MVKVEVREMGEKKKKREVESGVADDPKIAENSTK